MYFVNFKFVISCHHNNELNKSNCNVLWFHTKVTMQAPIIKPWLISGSVAVFGILIDLVIDKLVSVFPVRKWSYYIYVFTRFCHSVHGGGSPGLYPGRRLRGLAGGISRPIPRGEVEGSGRGVSRPIPRGEVEGSGQGGLQAQAQGGPGPGGGCIPACTEADPHRATAADGTHPTGMDSCSAFNLQFEAMRKEFLT